MPPMTGLIEVKLMEVNQLFNSMDPSPFHERDLDRNAEEFIVSWAQEHPRQHDLKLVVHIARSPSNPDDAQKLVADSVAHYFAYRADMTLREFKRLMREGRAALAVGLAFLAACQVVASQLTSQTAGWESVTREGLTIIGWVAMWRPLEIYLYRWWPLLARRRLYRRLADMPVEVRCAASR
ncbi:MAG: hypothetical protein R3F13_08290 [Prosthecobacter sp.]